MFQKLSPLELERHRVGRSAPEYAEFVASLDVGEGGLVNIPETRVTRQTVKNRLNAAATAQGRKLKFLRRRGDTLVFEVMAASDEPKRRRGRPPKSATVGK
jgi:hypothetical protein